MKAEIVVNGGFPLTSVEDDPHLTQGRLTCDCGESVYVILRDGETYPCPKCDKPLKFDSSET